MRTMNGARVVICEAVLRHVLVTGAKSLVGGVGPRRHLRRYHRPNAGRARRMHAACLCTWVHTRDR